jgi:hypothetical protein
MPEIDPLELAALQMNFENERERRFLATLTPDAVTFVLEADRDRSYLIRQFQTVLTETDRCVGGLAAQWIAEHVADVGERAATVMKMRIRHAERDPFPLEFRRQS